MPAKLRNGVQGTRGGRRPGAGRPPDWFKMRCREIACSPKFLVWAKKVIEGEPVETRLTQDGRLIMMPAPVLSRLAMWESLADRAFGKPASIVEMGDLEESATLGLGIVILPRQMEKDFLEHKHQNTGKSVEQTSAK